MRPYSVVLGITGGIAAYKCVDLVSRLRKAGCSVDVILTQHAAEFVSALSLETISNRPVVRDMFHRETPWEVEHIALAKKADLFLIAPATANIIGKMAHGIADDMLSTTIMACTAPILIAPAMNTHMYQNPVVQDNIHRLHDLGYHFIGPDSGMLACGDEGPGRMSDLDSIVTACMDLLRPQQDLTGKRIVVTAGPTVESIDPVRYITNHSSGKMGYAIAQAAQQRGAEVTLISGPVQIDPPLGIEHIAIMSTQDMYEAVITAFPDCDAVIKAAAPADYRPAHPQDQKIKKAGDLSIDMVRTPDIAAHLGSIKDHQKLILFAAETQHLLDHAIQKCQRKNADMLVANDITLVGAGFGSDTNIAHFVYPDGSTQSLPQMTKDELAHQILDELIHIMS